MWYRSHCYRVQTPASVTGIFICIFLTDTPQSFIKVGLFCSGSVDVTALSLENDSVWQQQANRCRRSAQSAKSLVTTWCGGWKLQVCVDICVCVSPGPSSIKSPGQNTKRTGMKCFLHLVDEGCGFTKQDTIPIHSVRSLCVCLCGVFFIAFFFLGDRPDLFVWLCLYVAVTLTFIWKYIRKRDPSY